MRWIPRRWTRVTAGGDIQDWELVAAINLPWRAARWLSLKAWCAPISHDKVVLRDYEPDIQTPQDNPFLLAFLRDFEPSTGRLRPPYQSLN